MKTLQSGDTGRDVEVWQRFLARVWIGEADAMMPGVFDEATAEATHLFQERHGIEPTALVDRETIAQARLLGLDEVDTLVPGSFSKAAGLAVLVMVVAFSILSQCMLSPSPQTGLRPLDNPRTPGASPRSACPGWFC
jgi:hypothetical protein